MSKIKMKSQNHHIAPWHFATSHRRLDENGIWHLVDFDNKTIFFDGDKKKWIGFPRPILHRKNLPRYYYVKLAEL